MPDNRSSETPQRHATAPQGDQRRVEAPGLSSGTGQGQRLLLLPVRRGRGLDRPQRRRADHQQHDPQRVGGRVSPIEGPQSADSGHHAEGSKEMMRLVVVGLLMCVGSFAADVPPVHASEDAGSVQLDNGFVALHFSKESGTFTAIRRYRDGKLEDVAVGPEAYYWDSNTEPDGAPAGIDVPNKGYFRPAHPAVRVISGADAAEIVAS